MHAWQIKKPQRQLQQKGTFFEQQWQVSRPLRRRQDRLPERVAESFIVCRSPAEVLSFKVVNATMRQTCQSSIN
jgi:hypothetical protein